MIHEIAHIQVKPGLQADFERGVAEAAPLFKRARGCRGLVGHCFAAPPVVEHVDTVRSAF